MHNGVIVAGMHRSGTSAMTRVLNLLGCALSENLIGPNLGNERGHWESIDIVSLNDAIFSAAGTSWDDWASVNSDWRASPMRNDAILKAEQLVRQHSELGPLFVMKDPRISKIADIWLEAFKKAKVQPSLIIMLRNPIEVAGSLERRDMMSPAYGHLLWLRYMLDAEFYSRGHKRTFCQFDKLLGNWPAVIEQLRSDLGLFFPRNSSSVQSQIDQFIDDRDRHHNVKSEVVSRNPNLSIWLRETYEILLRWSESGEDTEDWPTLDGVRKGLNQSAPAFAQLILAKSQSGGAGEGERLRLNLQEQLEQARLAQEEANRAVEGSRQHVAEAQAREESLAAQIELQSQKVQDLEVQIAALRAEADQLGALNETIASLHSLEDHLKEQLEVAQQAISVVQQKLDQETRARSAAEERLSEKTEYVSNLQSREADLSTRINELEKLLNQATHDNDAEKKARSDTELRLTETQDALAQAEADRGSAENRLSTAESALIQRREELSQLWQEVEVARSKILEIDFLREERNSQDIRLAELTDKFLLITSEHQAVREAEQSVRLDLAEEMQKRIRAEARLEALNEHLIEIRQQLDDEKESGRSARDVAEVRLEARFSEIAQLTTFLRDAFADLDAARSQFKNAELAEQRLTKLLQKRDEDVAVAEAARRSAERQLSSHFSEIAKLTQLLNEANGERDIARSQVDAERKTSLDLANRLQRQEDKTEAAELALHQAEQKAAPFQADASDFATRSNEFGKEGSETPSGTNPDITAHLTSLLQKRDQDVGAAEAARSVAERQLSARFTEIATLTKLLRDASSETDTSKAHAQWLRRVNAVTASFPKWWALMPAEWRRRHENARFERKGLFNAEKYLRLYPDVAESGMDPMKHYIIHGMEENRRNPV